jgi:hypothetical protein
MLSSVAAEKTPRRRGGLLCASQQSGASAQSRRALVLRVTGNAVFLARIAEPTNE